MMRTRTCACGGALEIVAASNEHGIVVDHLRCSRCRGGGHRLVDRASDAVLLEDGPVFGVARHD
ncbi:hypothetical protein [Natronorubrum sp. A-ect3]|uniref:hypothetical protein n=1 Tax=Natronorubrum sp. A-ect3 TaxID=3242698 RepID=UPI00359E2579